MNSHILLWIISWIAFSDGIVTAVEFKTNFTNDNITNCLDEIIVHITPSALESILQLNSDLVSNDSYITDVPFLERFPRFLLTFDWSGENETAPTNIARVLNNVASCNVKNMGKARFKEITLWISIIPANNIAKAAEQIVNVIYEVNSKFNDTVSTLLLNYRFLQLSTQSVPLVRQDVEIVRHQISKSSGYGSLNYGIMLDRHNCQGKDEHLRKLGLTTDTEVIFMSHFTPAEDLRFHLFSVASCFPLQKIMRGKPSVMVAESFRISLDTASYSFKFPASDEVLQQYSLLTAGRYNGSLVFTVELVGMKNTDKRTKENVTTRSIDKADEKWLKIPTAFNKNHFGVSISANDKSSAVRLMLPPIIRTFRKIVVDSRIVTEGGSNNNSLADLILYVASYKIASLRQMDKNQEDNNKAFQDGIPVEMMVIANLYQETSEGNRKSIADAFAASISVNEVGYPGIVHTILLSWANCFEKEALCVKADKETVTTNANKLDLFRERFLKLLPLLLYAVKVKNHLMKEREHVPKVGVFWDLKFCLKLNDFIRFWGNDQLRDWLDEADIFMHKVLVHKQEILANGAETTCYALIQDIQSCEQNMETRFPSKLNNSKLPLFIKVTGCYINHSIGITELAEIARFWELMNIWAGKENRNVILDSALQNQRTESNTSVICDLNASYRPSGECDCGWWIINAYDNQSIFYEDRKSLAWKLYQEENGLNISAPKLAAGSNFVDNTNVILMATLIPIIVVVIVVSILTLFLVLRYRSKYLLSRHEIKEFLYGKSHHGFKRSVGESSLGIGSNVNAETERYNKERYELTRSSFKLDATRCIGSGEFAVVCIGSINRGGAPVEVAVKATKKHGVGSTHGDLMALKGLISEIKMLSFVGEHKHIIKLEGAYTANLRVGKVFVFLELCPLGSLDKYLRAVDGESKKKVTSSDRYETVQKGRNTISVQLSSDLYRWASEIACGMEFLVSKNLVHADIATRNILLNSEMCAKICDFGLSRRLYNYTNFVKEQQEPLPWRWMAPESLRRMVFNEKTDVWAFGVTLWEMYTLGDEPYSGLAWDVNFPAMLDRGLRLQKPKFDEKQMHSLMMQCWKEEPDQRPTFAELKSILVKMPNLQNADEKDAIAII